MSDFLSFDSEIPSLIRINLIPDAIKSAQKEGLGTEWFRKASECKRILISKSDRDGSESYYLYIYDKVLKCIITNDKMDGSKVFLGMYFTEDNFYSKNRALHSGKSFIFHSGILIAFFSDNNNSFAYRNGMRIERNAARVSCSAAIKDIVSAFNTVTDNETGVAEESFQPTDELVDLLSLAKEYSEAQYELEEIEAFRTGALYYTCVEGCDYDRTENVAYRFYVEFAEKQREKYVVDTMVEVCDKESEKQQATIVKVGEDEKGDYVDLLFFTQLSIETLPSVGSLSPSVSSVNRDVQLEAINKIISGSSDAKYMNDILGDASPRGFDDIDLRKLDDELKNLENKPNDSQSEAIFKGIRSKDAYLVMGPPGTGKTTVICEWVKYFVKERNMRVLISSKNNKAVDNVLEKIIGLDGIEPLRIGAETKVSSEVKSCIFELKLDELRTKIRNQTSGHISILGKLSSFWDNVRIVLMGLGDVYEKKAVLEKRLDEAIQKLFKSYQNINVCAADFKNCEQKMADASNRANRLISMEKRYREKSFFVRIFTKIISLFRVYLIRFNISKYDRLYLHREQLYSVYFKMRSQFKSMYESIAFDIFMPEREMGESIKEKVDALSIDYDSNKDKWGIFSFEKSRELQVESYSFYKETLDEIKLSIARADDVLRELEVWSGETCEKSNHTLKEILLDGINVVGATCIGINSQKRFSDLKFDVSIIDEAGQIQIHDVLVPMSVSNKLIMLGDHKQIPPMVSDDLKKHLTDNMISTEFLEKSLFEYMYMSFPDTNKSMLDTQYRMPSEIAGVLSDWFYDGKYKSFHIKSNLTSLIPVLSPKPFLIIDTSDNQNRYERNIDSGEQVMHDNPLEADICAKIGSVLYQKDFNLGKVGIIAALNAQVQLIRKRLKSMNVPSDYIDELASTLDSYQGQERDIIVYSFGRSSKKPPEMNGVGFLYELRRLNVAMSRCKQTLIMVGDMKFLSERCSTKDFEGNEVEYNKSEKNFGSFISYMLECVSNGAGEIISSQTFEKRFDEWKNQG